MKNIVLIGPMGCGKSSLGIMAARRLDLEFIDMDRFIEEKAGMTISRMFEEKGEVFFRDRESEAAIEISKKRGAVIATGGGVVLREENMRALRDTGCVIFIERPVDDILGDIETRSRPLLKGGGGAENLRKIYSERYDLYKRYADRVLKNIGAESAAVHKLVEIAEIYKNPRFAVLGDPIEHSKSPDIHFPVLLDFLEKPIYDKMHVGCGGIPRYLNELKKLRGFNLTMPHKQDIIPYLSGMSREAELSGSVNTVVCRGGGGGRELFGYTTDGEGFFSALESAGIDFEGKHMLILGSGGVTRAIAFRACFANNMKTGILARNEVRAEALKNEILLKIPGADIFAGKLCYEILENYVSKADILVNATPQGMTGVDSQWQSFEFIKALPKGAAVCELIYSPPETEFLKETRKLGYKCQNGLPMLIHQALIADELYLDMKIDRQFYFKKVAKNLKDLNKITC